MKETSIKAYHSIRSEAQRHRAVILETMKKLGRPATSEVISVHCRIRYDQVWRRMSELVKDEIVKDSGMEAKTSSGRQATMWELVSAQMKLF